MQEIEIPVQDPENTIELQEWINEHPFNDILEMYMDNNIIYLKVAE